MHSYPKRNNSHSDASPPICDELEVAVRQTFEWNRGHPVTDPEWEAARLRLIEFGLILQDWEQVDEAEAPNLLPLAA